MDCDDQEYSLEAETEPNEVKRTKKKKVPKKKGRKRKYPEAHDRSERKRRANHNEPYYSARGELKLPKEFKAVEECCKKECYRHFDLKTQEKIFTSFTTLGSFEARCLFIANCVKTQASAFKSRSKQCQRRAYSQIRVFYIQNIKICKKFLLKILQIHDTRIETALQKLSNYDITDKRGDHLKKKKKEKLKEETQSKKVIIEAVSEVVSNTKSRTNDKSKKVEKIKQEPKSKKVIIETFTKIVPNTKSLKYEEL